MTQKNCVIHETMEIHELLNSKTIAMSKAKMMQGIAFDQDLKALLGRSVSQSMTATNDLQNLLIKSQLQ